MTYEELEARRIAANTPPPGTSIVGPTAGDKGLSFGTDNTFDVYDEQEVRVVDGKGNVIFSGVGVDGANRAVAVAQSLSDDFGKNANFKIQKAERTIVDGSVGPDRYIDVAYAAPSQSGLGFLADNVLPFAASFIPGIGPIAGAALGSAISSGLQGRSLQDALVRAAIAGGSAYAGGQVFGPATPGASAPMTGANADLIPNALKGLNFGSLTSAAIPAGIGGAAGDIIVNAAGRAASNLAGSAVGSALGQAAASQIGATNKNNVVDGVDQDTGEIVAEAQRRTGLSPSGAGIGAVIANPVINGIDQVTGEIVAEGSKIKRPDDTGPPNLDLGLIDRLSGMENYADEIVVDGSRIVRTEPEFVVPDIGLGIGSITDTLPVPKMDPRLTEKSTLDKLNDAVDIVRGGAALLPLIPGGGGGGGGGGVGGAGPGLNLTTGALRPTIPRGGIGGAGRYPYTPETYGRRGGDQETEYVFFTRDPVTGQGSLQSATGQNYKFFNDPPAPMVPVAAPATAPVARAAAINPTTTPIIQAPTATITAAQPNSARYEEAVARASMTPQERALMRLVDQQQTAAAAAVPSTVQAPVAGIGTPASSTRVPSMILTAEGYRPNPAYTADVAMQRYRAELPNNNYYSPQERQQIMSSIENAYAQPGATGEQISDAYQNASVAATRARPQVGLAAPAPDLVMPPRPEMPVMPSPLPRPEMPELPRYIEPDYYTPAVAPLPRPEMPVMPSPLPRPEMPELPRYIEPDYYTPAVAPSTVQAEPIMGIGSSTAVAPMLYEAFVNPGAILAKKEGGEIDDDMVKHLVEYHKNGGHQGPGQVKGIGSGQDDKIPAWLSDGEYVWSAQDVADLGDGSTDEGVRRLDKMRQMVRRQAGRKDVKKIAKPQKGIDRMLKAVGGLA